MIVSRMYVRAVRTPRVILATLIVASFVLPIAVVRAQQTVAVDGSAAATTRADVLLARPTTIHVTRVSRMRAIDAAAASAKVPIQYQADMLEGYTDLVTVQLRSVPLRTVLDRVLAGTTLTVVPDARGQLMIVDRAVWTGRPLTQGSGSITGVVTDSASGRGLARAAVTVQGTALSTLTGSDGAFTFNNVPEGNRTVMVRLLGYRSMLRTVEVQSGSSVTLRVVLAPTATVLSGVVTTATGTQRKLEIGNDITTLNVDSIVRTTPVRTMTDLLVTRVPGLTITRSSGEPGAPSRLRLRGVGSIGGNNDPIFIVDGVRVYSSQSSTRNGNLAPISSNGSTSIMGRLEDGKPEYFAPSPIDQIDPNSIETVEVFKGPSASSLYGSDAANGVIVITTKRGRSGPTHWSLNLGQGVNWIPGKWPTNYFRFGTNLAGVGPLCNWYDPTCIIIDSVRNFQALNDSRYTVFDRGSDQVANVTVSGGVATLQYSFSGSGSGRTGNLKLPISEQQRYTAAYGPIPRWMIRPDKYTTWGIDGSLTALPHQAIRATLKSSLFNSAQQTSSLRDAIPQLQGIYIGSDAVISANGATSPLASTPLIQRYVQRVTGAAVTTRHNLTIGWTPRPWLPVSVDGGLETMQRTDKAYIPYGINASGPDGSCGAAICADTNGYFGLGRGVSQNRTLLVRTGIPFFQDHVTLAVGGNYYSGSTNDFQASTNRLAPGVSTPASFFYAACGDNCRATQSSSASSTYGWYLEPRFNVRSRFFVAPGFRLDGGSGGTSGGLSTFPKINFSYLAVDRQSTSPMWGFLTLFRPRLAFGLAGTQPAPELRLRLFNKETGTQGLNPGGQGTLVSASGCTSMLSLNGSTVPGVCLSSLGNTQLRPERSQELEGGFDVQLWQNRLTVTGTRYSKTRRDAIITIPMAPSVAGGVFDVALNIGEVRNTGTELTLNATVLQNRALSWNVGVNLSNNNNVLVRLNRGQSPNYNLGLVPGYPLFGQWIKPIVAFADQNRDGLIEMHEVRLGDSLVFQGQPNPKYQLALNSGVQLLNGRLGIYTNFAYQSGLTQSNNAALNSGLLRMSGNNPETPASYQAAIQAVTGCNFATCTGFNAVGTYYGIIQTVSTFRFNDLSINYEMPKRVASWFMAPRMSVALQGSNLALRSNYRGKDPDVNAFSTVTSVDQTADFGQIPMPRTWWLKFTLSK